MDTSRTHILQPAKNGRPLEAAPSGFDYRGPACYRQELENGRPPKARRERLEWQIRERQKRLADLEARLAKIRADSGP